MPEYNYILSRIYLLDMPDPGACAYGRRVRYIARLPNLIKNTYVRSHLFLHYIYVYIYLFVHLEYVRGSHVTYM